LRFRQDSDSASGLGLPIHFQRKAMRAEIESVVNEINESLALLRRHL
jgi:hypothetical protein